MKKQIVRAFAFSMVMFCAKTTAQNKLKLGLDGGYTYTALVSDLTNRVDSKYETSYGYGINFTAELSIWKTLFSSIGVSYLQKNYKFVRTNSREGWYTDFTNNYFSFPLLVGGYLLNDPHSSNGIWLKLAGGMYTEYWQSLKRKGRYPAFAELQEDNTFNYVEVSEKYDWKENRNQLKRFGYGLQGQAQLGYSLNNLDVYLSYNYQYGLSNINKKDLIRDYDSSVNSYMLSVGVAYKFK